MARQVGRNWNQEHIRVWNNDKENNSPAPPPRATLPSLSTSLPPLLPPPPPPPLLPPPPTSFQSESNEKRSRQWDKRISGIYEDEYCYNAWTRNEERDSSTGFDPCFPGSRRSVPSTQIFYGVRDVDTAKQRFGQQVYVVAPMQEKTKDEKSKKWKTRKDESRTNPPPKPPRLDFPVESRTSKREYRRVDDYDEDPTLRPELYPLEEGLSRKEGQGSYRQVPETIEILPERSVKQQDVSELNLVPTPSTDEDRMAEEYSGRTDVKSGSTARNPSTKTADKRSKEAQKKKKEMEKEERKASKKQKEQKRSQQDSFPVQSPATDWRPPDPSSASDERGSVARGERGMYSQSVNTRSESKRAWRSGQTSDFEESINTRRGIPEDDPIRSREISGRTMPPEDVGEPPYERRMSPQMAADDFRSRQYYSVDEDPGQRDFGTDRQRRSIHTDNTFASRDTRLDRQSTETGRKSRLILPSEGRSDGTVSGQSQDRRMAIVDFHGSYGKPSVQTGDDRRASYDRGAVQSSVTEPVDGTSEGRSGYVEPRVSDKFHDLQKEMRRSSIYGQSGSDSLRRRKGDSQRTVLSGRILPQYDILKEEQEDIPVERRDSVILPGMEENEKEFHDLVAAGDVAAVRIFLNEHPGFNINCVNYQQISALHVAVHEQNEEMVDFLLEQPSLECTDCALYAVKEGNVRIVEKIMDKLRETNPALEYAAISHSVDFPDYMTPIILAAQQGNYEIINFLIKRDHIIPPVHNPYCKCEACKADLQKYDRLKYSTMKLNLYKAISNPMYIFHVTDDPFQRAFDLTQELQDAAKVFPQFKTSYEELWRDLRNFTVDLIGCCRNSQEVEIILKKSVTNMAGSITFPRLQYAIDLKQKEFVSHPYTQAVLVDAWTGDLLEWKVQSPLMQALAVFPRIPMLPIMAVMCMILPNHKLVRKWKTPVNKMISSVASYLIFLIILFLESNLDKKNQKRGPPNSGLEGLIIIYVLGYIWLNIRLCFRLGPKRFFSTMWHWFDCIMIFLFTMTIVFWIASLADITANDEIDLPRKYWNALDPELVAEGFFTAAVIMAFFRLNMFLSLNYHLGPLQVSIGKMTLDIFRFIIIFFILIFAWCAGLCRFYQPYDGMIQKDSTSGSSTTQVSSFVSFSMTLKTLFWAIFGMSPIESADVVIENLPGDTPETTIINHHEFTEAVGYIAFALFQFLSVVVVLNMLVACMANTFTKVIDNVTVEWVYGRSQIYLSFMAASTLPPPFNLLPTASGIKSALLWLKLLSKPNNGQRAKCNFSHCCYIENETEEYVNSEFPALMSELAQRYIRLKGEIFETQDDLEELKYEVKELLRKMDGIIAIRKNA